MTSISAAIAGTSSILLRTFPAFLNTVHLNDPELLKEVREVLLEFFGCANYDMTEMEDTIHHATRAAMHSPHEHEVIVARNGKCVIGAEIVIHPPRDSLTTSATERASLATDQLEELYKKAPRAKLLFLGTASDGSPGRGTQMYSEAQRWAHDRGFVLTAQVQPDDEDTTQRVNAFYHKRGMCHLSDFNGFESVWSELSRGQMPVSGCTCSNNARRFLAATRTARSRSRSGSRAAA